MLQECIPQCGASQSPESHADIGAQAAITAEHTRDGDTHVAQFGADVATLLVHENREP